ncbi:MAG: tetratricopeptide repeat protein, partial [Bacteroidales bacterium]|nr:tetratricopeptide repeat protein [Bacteroidales bacterium]
MISRTCRFFILVFFPGALYGNITDSLQIQFNSQSGTEQIETGIRLCYQLSDEPEKMLQASLSLLGKTTMCKINPSLIAKTYRVIADAYYYCNQIENSTDYLLKAVSMAKSDDGNLAFLAEAYNDLGLNYRNLDENEKALEHLNKAAEINKRLNRPDLLADVISNQAAIYHTMGQYEKAINMFNEAYEIDLSTGNVKSQSSSLNNLGRMYVDMGKYKTGIEFYQRSLALLDTITDRKLLGVRYNNIGLAYQLMGRHTEAIQW